MFKRLKPTLKKQPERSRSLRLIILLAMLVPMLALAHVHPGLWPHALLGAVGISLGHWYSYRNLDQNRQLVRGLMFIAIHLALGWMFVGLVIGATVPQAQFAIYAQAITSFDLRYRSSLFNTLIHSLANLYVAASLSRTGALGLYLILFLILVLAAFFIAERDSGLARAKLQPDPPFTEIASINYNELTTRIKIPLLFALGFGLLVMLALGLVFLLTPRFASRPLVPPFTLNLPLRGGLQAEIINPGVPLVQVNGWSDEVSDYYYGFDTQLDLRYRGGLSDDIVMYVRSPSRSYWRSHSYDFYSGTTWSQSDTSLTDIPNGGVYWELPIPLGSPESPARLGEPQTDGHRVWRPTDETPHHLQELFNTPQGRNQEWHTDQQIVQTFTIVRDQPNLLFAAYRPNEIFLVSERLSLDTGDGLRLPETLHAGMTYSVVSYRPDFSPEQLRRLPPGPYPADIAKRYLQLPPHISERVRRLARDLTGPHSNAFDQVQALNDHLLTYPYNFFPPSHPPGAEVVHTFLFEDKEGVCEQYVTALVVMARSLGIPARLAAGYGAGDYNPITGYYEVRYSHAHAWAEVYFPEVGWVPFDPTPGWTPQPYPTPVQNWLWSNNGQLFKQLTGLDLPINAVVSGGVTGLAFFLPFLATSALLVGLVLLALYLARLLARRLKPVLAARPKMYTSFSDDPPRRLILSLYAKAIRLTTRRRRQPARRPAETPAELARRLDNPAGFSRLTDLVEVAAYRPTLPTNVTDEARSAWNEVQSELRSPPL